MKEENKTIWTIGHSTRPLEEFVAILHSFNIDLIADIRSYPGSRRFPQFNKETLEASFQYVHLKDLGGGEKRIRIQKILVGGILLFEAMPIIWKQPFFKYGI